MATDPFAPPLDRSKPVHHWYTDSEQFRLKVQRFTAVPPEITIQRVAFDSDVQRYEHAYHSGQSSCFRSPSRTRPDPGAERSPEAVERSQRRAKTGVRLAVVELAPTALVTFTTRAVLTLDELLWCWGHFTRSMRRAAFDFEYVAVPERHPKNPEHLHLHVAYRGRTPFAVLRRLWHVALEALRGRRVTCILRGPESPGNIDVQTVKSRDTLKRVRKIARYISKYITKDLIAEFNRRRYWPSKGVNVRDAQVFWLEGLTAADAIREACILVGEWDHANDMPTQRFFRPSDRVCWFAVDPEATPPPPF